MPRNLTVSGSGAMIAIGGSRPDLMVTLASWEIPPAELRKLVPYLSHWCFWSTKYFTGKEYAPLLKELREKGKNI